MSDLPPSTAPDFRGTLVRDDGTGALLLQHKLRLYVTKGADAGLEKEVAAPRLVLGTAALNDIVLTDSTVSRQHCEIFLRKDRYVVRDLDSTNGTRIDGTAIVEAFLAPGSRLSLGDTELLFEPKRKWSRIEAAATDHFGRLRGSSPAMLRAFALLEKIAPTDLSCVLVGETGTGKELAAAAIHEASERAQGPFVVVDCGAISENLVEAELFGHERGAFTSADRARAGAFELAHGGTVFLDEIGELALELQPKLLRALERREVRRLGAPAPTEVDVRVLAATHRDLPSMVEAGKFREDLYYRFAEVVVALPPLRERVEDIPLIATHILDEETRAATRVRSIAKDAMQALCSMPWRGNVRELRNTLRRAMAFASGEELTRADLEPAMPRAPSVTPPEARPRGVEGASALDADEGLSWREARERWTSVLEHEYLARLVRRCGGDLDRASEEAGLHRKSLERLLRHHQIKASTEGDP